MLSLLANPTSSIKASVALLQLVSTAVSLRGSRVLRNFQTPGVPSPVLPPTVIGAGNEEELVPRDATAQVLPAVQARKTLLDSLRLIMNVQVWQLMVIEWCAGFIFTLNSQAAGTIYWSSIVGVSDSMRSVYIALESALGGGLVGFISTLCVTRLYHRQADVSVIIPRIVAAGAVVGGLLLACFGTTSAGALLGITSLYLYYFIFAWSNIEFLRLLDSLRAGHGKDQPLLCMFLLKDIAGGLLNNLRNVALMWTLAATGFYEPDCKSQCAVAAGRSPEDCVARCRDEAHANVGPATVMLVRALYVLVTPGAYLIACLVMRAYRVDSALEPRH